MACDKLSTPNPGWAYIHKDSASVHVGRVASEELHNCVSSGIEALHVPSNWQDASSCLISAHIYVCVPRIEWHCV